MSYRILDNGFALVDGDMIPPDHYLWDERVQPLIDAGVEPEADPLPTIEQRNRAIRDAAWQWMASVPQARGYDSIESCCSYAQSSVARYKAEALAMIAWRDAVNQRLEQLALNPPAGVETWEQVVALLPQPEEFAWPPAVDLPITETPPANPDS